MKNIIITYGGESCEHDISIITALNTYNFANKNQYNFILVCMRNNTFYVGKALTDINTYIEFSTKNLMEVYFNNRKMYYKKRCKKPIKIECALMCNHGGDGENGCLSGFFAINNIPFTASSSLSSGICMDKAFSKLLLEKFKLPVISYQIYRPNDSIDSLEEKIGYPMIIKPANLGSSVGIAYANNYNELVEGIDFALQFDKKLLIEKALTDFEEYNCAAFSHENGIEISSIERPIFSKEYLNFYDKYLSNGEIKREIDPTIAKKLSDRIIAITKKIYELFELDGIIRVDYLFANNKLYVNEINTIPGSLAFYLFKSKNYDFGQIIKLSIERAVASYNRKQLLVKDFSSNVLQNYSNNKLKVGIKK